jgi:hypothetical protein
MKTVCYVPTSLPAAATPRNGRAIRLCTQEQRDECVKRHAANPKYPWACWTTCQPVTLEECTAP